MEQPVPTLAREVTHAPACLDSQVPAVRSRWMNALEILVATEAAALWVSIKTRAGWKQYNLWPKCPCNLDLHCFSYRTMTMAISAPVYLVFMATTASWVLTLAQMGPVSTMDVALTTLKVVTSVSARWDMLGSTAKRKLTTVSPVHA